MKPAIVYVKDSEGGNSLGLAPHGMDELNNSIAIYNNMLSLFQGENYNSLTDKLDFVRPKTNQVERLLASLSELGSVKAKRSKKGTSKKGTDLFLSDFSSVVFLK